jgi:hypothetical protein
MNVELEKKGARASTLSPIYRAGKTCARCSNNLGKGLCERPFKNWGHSLNVSFVLWETSKITYSFHTFVSLSLAKMIISNSKKGKRTPSEELIESL